MPHKDREARLAYLRRWKEAKRPSPQPEEQAAEGLPPVGRIVFSEDGQTVQCHVCGEWWGSLNVHIRKHGYDAASYKEAFGIGRIASMWPPALKEKQRQAALYRGQGDVGRAHLPHDGGGRPAGQETRLSVKIEASEARKGVYTRGGHKTKA